MAGCSGWSRVLRVGWSTCRGLACESLYGGDQVLRALGPMARQLAQGAMQQVLPFLTMGQTRRLARSLRSEAQSTSAISPRFLPEAFSASVAAMNPSRSPFSTPCVSEVS